MCLIFLFIYFFLPLKNVQKSCHLSNPNLIKVHNEKAHSHNVQNEDSTESERDE